MKEVNEMHVAVLAGGPGSEREVSMASAQGVAGALIGNVAKVTFVDVKGADFVLPDDVDVAFNAIHGTFGEDGKLQAELESRGVPYTGARRKSSELAFDKILSKNAFVSEGVNTPDSEVVLSNQENCTPHLIGIPCVVKPPREGSSVGVHLVETPEKLSAAIADAGRYSEDVMVEQLIRGKELTVGIVGDEIFPVVHIQPRSGFYDISNKYPWITGEGGTDYFCPADLSDEVTRAVQEQALKAHRSLGIEVYSRVDVLLREADNTPFVLEVNTIPGMTESSLLPKAAAEGGMNFANLCLKIIKLSLNL